MSLTCPAVRQYMCCLIEKVETSGRQRDSMRYNIDISLTLGYTAEVDRQNVEFGRRI